MSIEEIIEFWKHSRAISPCITDLRIFKKREGQYRPFPKFIHPIIREALGTEGIEQLYSHQVEAVEAVHEGKDIVVVSPTASGKTLCYNLPVLNTKLEMPFSKAFYLFPTKALSQDQMFELQSFIQRIRQPMTTFTYDGDTPQDARQAIRTQGDIVITNPDMLHTGILPHHT
ncbi:MAG: DEAD/DEAH box helicase, partial [Thermodesulfobacteriota bacterium]